MLSPRIRSLFFPERTVELRVETVAFLVSVFFTLFCNTLFWRSSLSHYDLAQARTWLVAATLLILLVALHYVLLSALLFRRTAKPVLVVLLTATALAVYFMDRFHVYLDPSMLRNVLATDVAEARDLLAWGLLPGLLLYAGVPLWLLGRTRFKRDPLRRAVLWRVGTVVFALLCAAGVVLSNYQEMASLMRNHRELRYLVTPGNFLVSFARAAGVGARHRDGVRAPIGADAVAGASWAQRSRPVVVVMVLGETARAANWGLSGYSRQTTPGLAAAGVVNFASVRACGTATETSVPCIFSPWGRRQYDEDRIRGSESLLDVMARAGFRVVWVDNQSGCKGVCKGVELQRPDPAQFPGLCPDGQCYDGALVGSLKQVMAETPGNLFVVLHQIGNHGPAYFKRYPADFRAFQPACENADLPKCSRQEIVNAYDNAIHYTDHVLTEVTRLLASDTRRDGAMLYVSDHGESLGESGLYLHGIPYAIAPDVQTEVPMVLWAGRGFQRSFGIDPACLAQRARGSASHDNIFHTFLGMLDVKTGIYEREMDLTAGCRRA